MVKFSNYFCKVLPKIHQKASPSHNIFFFKIINVRFIVTIANKVKIATNYQTIASNSLPQQREKILPSPKFYIKYYTEKQAQPLHKYV